MADDHKQYDLEQVVTIRILEEYLINNLHKLIASNLPKSFKIYSEQEKLNLVERIVRVEDAIKAQNEKIELLLHQMDKRFEQVDKRFEQVDKRFEQVDKRFEQVDKRFDDLIHYMDKRFSVTQWIIGLGFTLIVVMMSIFEFIK